MKRQHRGKATGAKAAEVERVRAEHLESQRNGAAVAVQLAAANARIDCARAILRRVSKATPALAEDIRVWIKATDDLAAQPATAPVDLFPTVTGGKCVMCGAACDGNVCAACSEEG